jgi:hypothetical protein
MIYSASIWDVLFIEEQQWICKQSIFSSNRRHILFLITIFIVFHCLKTFFPIYFRNFLMDEIQQQYMKEEKVILVDEEDTVIGSMPKGEGVHAPPLISSHLISRPIAFKSLMLKNCVPPSLLCAPFSVVCNMYSAQSGRR